MKIVDRFGNELTEGDTVVWMVPGTNGLMAAVSKVDQGGIALPTPIGGKGSKVTTGKVVMQVVISLPEPDGRVVVQIGDLIKSFNPESAGLIESMLSR